MNTKKLMLGTGVPFEVWINNPKTGEVDILFLSESDWLQLQRSMNDKGIRFFNIGGSSYFWSDVRRCERVKLAGWLEDLIWKSGKIAKEENRMRVVYEAARLSKEGRKFLDEEQVFVFLSLNQ